MTPAAQSALDTIRGILDPLSDDAQREIITELLGVTSKETNKLREEVYTARRLLMARPDETLAMAIVRMLTNNAKVEP